MKTNFTKIICMFIAFISINYAQAQCSSGQTEVVVTVVEDNYGSETSWQITGVGGTPVYLSGGPYTNGNNGNSHTDQVCIPDGTNCIFKITDSYGDGICCAYGNGSYTVTINNCNVVASGGSFGSSESKNFTVVPQPTVDLSLSTVDIDEVISMGNITFTGSLINLGSSDVSSFNLNYSINNGATVTQPINSTVASCATYNYTHNTPWNASAAGTYTVKVWISDVSGTDQDNTNNEITKTVIVATQSVTSIALMEEFTSSTCAPCASLNNTMDPLLTNTLNVNQQGSNVAAIKYQMNWPSPGNDPSYNPDGVTRKTFYSVNSAPTVFLDGKKITGSQATNSGTYSAEAAKPAYFDIDLSYALNWGNEVDVTAVVTPYANFPGSIKLFIAVLEDYYSYPASTTSQDDYHFVQRKMLPNGNGNTLSNITAGSPITVNKSYSFTLGGAAQGNFNLWGNSMDDITVVAFVQNMTTKEVYQAAFVNSPTSTGISEDARAIALKVFPNPFSNQTNVSYQVDGMENVSIRILNIAGQQVYSNDLGLQTSGTHNLQINADNFASGIYVMNLMIGSKIVSHKLSVTK